MDIDTLIADLERANRLLEQTERRGVLLAAMLVLAAGGEIRITRDMITGTGDLNLDRTDDPETGTITYTVTAA